MTRKEKLDYFKLKGYSYNSGTGDIISHKGKNVGRPNKNGYLRLTMQYGEKKNNKYIEVYSHQLAYYLYYDEVPNEIDHINRNVIDNRIVNLRSCTSSQNKCNIPRKGYYLDKRNNRYRAEIHINYKKISLGGFDTADEAHEAYLKAKKIYHKEYAPKNNIT